MQTIGEKLEDARKRRGIAIREASEFTKIRGEYLAGFETNNFDINLPEIYVRGFLRTYATFLNLNPDKLITDYSAYRLGDSKIVRREKELLGRMDLPGAEAESEETSGHPSPAANPAPAATPRRQMGTDEDGDDYGSLGRASYPKVAAALGGAVVLAGLLLFLVLAVLKSGPTEAQANEPELNGAGSASGQNLILSADGGDIMQVIVTELETRRELYRGPLANGETRTVPFDQRVRLSYTEAQHLVIEKDGERFQLAGQGMGQSNFP